MKTKFFIARYCSFYSINSYQYFIIISILNFIKNLLTFDKVKIKIIYSSLNSYS